MNVHGADHTWNVSTTGPMTVNESNITFEDIKLYPYPNPALANILLGAPMLRIVSDSTRKVLAVFLALQKASQTPYSDPGRQFRAGGHPQGELMRQTEARVDVGPVMDGMPSDRWCGTITVPVAYGGSTIYGRHAYYEYEGNRALQEALYTVFPYSG
jgi:hypothetical protein